MAALPDDHAQMDEAVGDEQHPDSQRDCRYADLGQARRRADQIRGEETHYRRATRRHEGEGQRSSPGDAHHQRDADDRQQDGVGEPYREEQRRKDAFEVEKEGGGERETGPPSAARQNRDRYRGGHDQDAGRAPQGWREAAVEKQVGSQEAGAQ